MKVSKTLVAVAACAAIVAIAQQVVPIKRTMLQPPVASPRRTRTPASRRATCSRAA